MPNNKHQKILGQGVLRWNRWRDKNPDVYPDLTGLDLHGTELDHVDLSFADLRGTNLSFASLRSAKLNSAQLEGADLRRARLSNADLRFANLNRADLQMADVSKALLVRAELNHSNLIGSDFSHADLTFAYLNTANLSYANLSRANLSHANLSWAVLTGTNLGDANLDGADLMFTAFVHADLSGTTFNQATTFETVFAGVDFRNARVLESVRHWGPSELSINTVYFSEGHIPEIFLRNCGVPDTYIAQIPLLVGAAQALQFNSCFISYSNQDEEFVSRLHTRMLQAGMRVWFAPENVKGGDKLYDQIERAIQGYDRLLLVLSESSMKSGWVETEIRRARKVERQEGRRKLFPIRLVSYEALQEWVCIDSATGENLAEEVRGYFIPDFMGWKSYDDFERAFSKLLTYLKASE